MVIQRLAQFVSRYLCQVLPGFEWVKCDILPPRNLYHPILPVKMYGELIFPLCRKCVEDKVQEDCMHENEKDRIFGGTRVSEEVKKAIEVCYRIKKIFEISQYKITQYDPGTGQGGLFPGYIDEFFKQKTLASGFPLECNNNPRAMDQYIQDFEKFEGIKLDKNQISLNPGERSVAKLCLNSLWDKIGQRGNMPKTEIVTDPQRLVDMLTNSEVEVIGYLPDNDYTMYVCWRYNEEAMETSPVTNVVVAAYTTAQARLNLYSYLEPLGEPALSYDTDSIIYVSNTDIHEYELPTRTLLGEMTDELSCYGIGSYIISFVSGGPKFYAYMVRKPDGTESCTCKVKGIRLNYTNAEKINFDSIRDLVIGEIPHILLTFDSIRLTNLHDVTREENKIWKPVYAKRRFINLHKSYPYGYKTP